MKACIHDVKQLGSILGVWAHPDDEVYSMGGIMAAAASNGQRVACVTATRGEAGVQDATRWPPEQLGEIRSRELEASYEILGVSDHVWFDYPDGGCKEIRDEEAVGLLANLIDSFQPDTILTFGPDGLTGHDDHKTVSKWADLAAQKVSSRAKIYHVVQTQKQYDSMREADKQFNFYFNIDKPPIYEEKMCGIYYEMPDKAYRKKLAALHAMPSQTEAMLKKFEPYLYDSLATEAFVCTS